MGVIHKLRQRFNREKIYSTAAYWDARAETYCDLRASMWPNRYLDECYHRWQLQWLRNILGDMQGKRVLEIGCGTGRITFTLAHWGAMVTGLDFSQKAIACAKAKTTGDWPKWKCQSIFDLSEVESFDVVVSVVCLAVACRDLVALRDVLERCRRALTAGGLLVLIEPFHRGFLHRVLNANRSEVAAVLRETGFREEFSRMMGFWRVRLVLAEIEWPRLVTVVLAHSGEWALQKIFKGRVLGDYTILKAVKE